MRRSYSAAFLLSALTCTPVLLAQLAGGGHAGGSTGGEHFSAPAGHAFSGYAGHGSFRGGVAPAPAYGSHAFAPPGRMTFAAPGHGFQPGYIVRPRGEHPSWGGGWDRDDHRGHRGDRSHGRGYDRSPYGGYGAYGYPGNFVNSWEVLPWDLGASDYSDDFDDSSDGGGAATQPPSAADAQPQPSESGPSSESGPYRDGYAPSPGADYPPAWVSEAPAPPPNVAPVTPEPELTLIFRDGHRQSIRNYVLTPDTLVVLDKASTGRQQRIPLSELNLQATEEAARQAGLDFSLPRS
jgi:hypothetical protein